MDGRLALYTRDTRIYWGVSGVELRADGFRGGVGLASMRRSDG